MADGMNVRKKHTAYPEKTKVFLNNGQAIGIFLVRLPVVCENVS